MRGRLAWCGPTACTLALSTAGCVGHQLTTGCSRRLTASAPLPLSGAAEPQAFGAFKKANRLYSPEFLPQEVNDHAYIQSSPPRGPSGVAWRGARGAD